MLSVITSPLTFFLVLANFLVYLKHCFPFHLNLKLPSFSLTYFPVERDVFFFFFKQYPFPLKGIELSSRAVMGS